jgi:type II secretory pathway predicted ATPase ExeA
MRNQMLLYIGGEGGVGKSQIVKAIVAGIDLIQRKQEVILMAPIGVAANNISGNTCHAALGINIGKTQNNTISPRVRKL